MQVPTGHIEVVGSDAELRALIEQGGAAGWPKHAIGPQAIGPQAIGPQAIGPRIFGLAGGDLMRTVGGTGDRSRFTGDQPIPHLPIDLVRVVADDQRSTVFVAHLVARRSWLWGQATAVMNAQFLSPARALRRHGADRSWDVAPRSHPNDGRFDIVTAAAGLGARQRWMARSRLRLGTHVPHPQISVRQQAGAALDLPVVTPLWVDGTRWGSARHLRLDIEPDALIVCV